MRAAAEPLLSVAEGGRAASHATAEQRALRLGVCSKRPTRAAYGTRTRRIVQRSPRARAGARTT